MLKDYAMFYASSYHSRKEDSDVSYLPVAACCVLSDAKSDNPLAKSIVILLVAVRTSKVTVCIREEEAFVRSFIIVLFLFLFV